MKKGLGFTLFIFFSIQGLIAAECGKRISAFSDEAGPFLEPKFKVTVTIYDKTSGGLIQTSAFESTAGIAADFGNIVKTEFFLDEYPQFDEEMTDGQLQAVQELESGRLLRPVAGLIITGTFEGGYTEDRPGSVSLKISRKNKLKEEPDQELATFEIHDVSAYEALIDRYRIVVSTSWTINPSIPAVE